tara:strand:- start:138 stop:464 length:327 start_codon:yes stop_codon:yes gene_type:complete
MKLIFILSSILLLSFTSCKKNVTKVNPELIGNWQSEDGDYGILIDENGFGSYENYPTFFTVTGQARLRKDVLQIWPKRFKVNQFPEEHKVPGGADYRTIILDDVTYRD